MTEPLTIPLAPPSRDLDEWRALSASAARQRQIIADLDARTHAELDAFARSMHPTNAGHIDPDPTPAHGIRRPVDPDDARSPHYWLGYLASAIEAAINPPVWSNDSFEARLARLADALARYEAEVTS